MMNIPHAYHLPKQMVQLNVKKCSHYYYNLSVSIKACHRYHTASVDKCMHAKTLDKLDKELEIRYFKKMKQNF